MQTTLHRLVSGNDLTREEAQRTLHALIEGQATAAQIGALLTALRMKGETVEEAAGFAQEMRAHMMPVAANRYPLLDTCGTGGSVCRVFNVSTAAALVAAAAGAAVAKHGNRAMSGVCGSADVLEALGVRIDLTPEQCAQCIDEIGIAFLFAPAHHPALKHVSGPRRELGIRTLFNLLGPLCNPAGATRRVMGVYDGSLCELAAGSLRELGVERALVVHAAVGMGEISTVGRTRVCELRAGAIESYVLTPHDLGLTGGEPDLADLAPAATVAENANIFRTLFTAAGRDAAAQARQDLLTVNAAAALRASGMVDDWKEGVEMAREVMLSGKPLILLEKLAAFSQRHQS